MVIGGLSLINKVILAPMAGITSLPFRSLARKFGCSLAFTEMISANGLVRGTKRSFRYLDSATDDKPLGVQIFGSDPATLAAAAEIAMNLGADLLDVNMGCPVRKVMKTGAGAALLRDPAKIKLILMSIRKAIPLPLTVKIRSGWNQSEIRAVEVARLAEDCGVDAVIIHPRTADQGFSGSADWRIIAAVKDVLHVPVIGSGDIRNPQDACRMIATTGCDGLMVGRSALGNPWIFKNIMIYLRDERVLPAPPLSERKKIIRDHMEMEILYSGEYAGIRAFRKHLLWYTKGLRDGSDFRQKISHIQDKNLILNEVCDLFRLNEEASIAR
jgi:tRNA-dihydrouridine synthase B